MREARVNDRWFRASLRREVALMAYAYNLAIEAEQEKHLRRRGKQGNDSHCKGHCSTLLQKWSKLEKSAEEERPTSGLLIKEILTSYLVERAERVRPAGHDFLRRHAILDLLDGVGISQKPDKFVCVKILGIEFLQNLGDL